jgi:hypothetical protein
MHGHEHAPWAFFRIARELAADSPPDYWRLLAETWSGAEPPSRNLGVAMLPTETWRALLTRDLPGRAHLMDAGKRANLAGMPDEVTVYRG